MSDGQILETDGLYKFFGAASAKVPVVTDVSISVKAGRFVTVMGPSGSGKSTLLHMVSGLEPPSGGTVHLDGHDLYAISEKQRTLLRRDLVGFVFQFYNLIPNLTAEENIRLPLMIGAQARPVAASVSRAAGAGGAADRDGGCAATGDSDGADRDGLDFDRLVELFSLRDHLEQYPHQLSGGEMQRVSIARALISKPAVIMADEPTGNISTSAGEEVMRLFRRCCDEFGQTILLVTHNPRDAAFSDEVHFLKDGELHGDVALRDEGVTAEAINASLKTLGI